MRVKEETNEELIDEKAIRWEVYQKYKFLMIFIVLLWMILMILIVWFAFQWSLCDKCIINYNNSLIETNIQYFNNTF